MNANEIIDSGVTLPRLASALPLQHSILKVVWAEGRRAGREDLIDVGPALHSYKIYKPLRNKEALFATARVVDYGDAVAWDGDDLEMSAEMLLALAEETMTPKDFSAFLVRHKLTQEVAGILLGRSRRQIANYTSTGPIPRVVALACYGYEARKRDALLARELQNAAAALGNPDVPTGGDHDSKAA